MRVRGLKLLIDTLIPSGYGSHPMRVRGLKHVNHGIIESISRTHAGAWIETTTR